MLPYLNVTDGQFMQLTHAGRTYYFLKFKCVLGIIDLFNSKLSSPPFFYFGRNFGGVVVLFFPVTPPLDPSLSSSLHLIGSSRARHTCLSALDISGNCISCVSRRAPCQSFRVLHEQRERDGDKGKSSRKCDGTCNKRKCVLHSLSGYSGQARKGE